MRIVSICPSNTEIVAYLGRTDLLAGVDNYSDWPPEVTQLPRVGPDLSVDMDKVEALNPDLVLASLSVPGMEKNIEALDKRKLPYIILNPNSLEEIADDIETVGEALGEKQLGADKAAVFRAEIEQFRDQAAKKTYRPTLYWEWWPKPVFTPGSVNWLTELSYLAGAQNIFDSHEKASVQTDWDDVKERDPDHICMVWVGIKESKMRPELVRRRPGWVQMKAIRENNIHVLEESLFCRPSPRLLEGLRKLTAVLE
ncbi:cobalamin-binding protein [Lentibacillus kapialis]|uniref:Cobalamin-binding protein n=1 Tax=Lentibacillus kapialis TaxID=340214 RepID=A0A917PQ49_9BACI|nr:cobalamin-binding protein [Lentibacillus kapialis]GGJ87994.1 cobalamin-binding protein [Lentibacillus kapialis]